MNIENRLDKKELVYNKEVDTGKLMEELYEAIPELRRTVYPDETFTVNLRVFTNEYKLTLWVPEDVSDSVITNIVELHTIEEV